jgi:hypothetical protein
MKFLKFLIVLWTIITVLFFIDAIYEIRKESKCLDKISNPNIGCRIPWFEQQEF